ncbi:hypothetical protein [Epilithonimonas sp.]|uniref:hypothetical protein n=1 Tax=Epilithonimonas sp. TaxID=2894511 RepID=UPI00289CE70D|nr:hypothetical protein [Epilithonimonas sp.]
MSRFLKNDLEHLKDYIDNFSLKNLLTNKDYIAFISTCHKKYYSFFVATIEFENSFTENQFVFLKEANSDIATALFHIMSGSYKSARFSLRSSIECFLKAFTMNELTDIEREKSVYEIFNKIKALPYFSSNPQKLQFDLIHSIYKDLCKDVHAAEKINMAQIDALDLLPKYQKKEAEKIKTIYLSLIPAYLFLLSDKFNGRFHQIHHSNRDIILMGILKELRPTIMKIEE